jgi:hypothetical protein
MLEAEPSFLDERMLLREVRRVQSKDQRRDFIFRRRRVHRTAGFRPYFINSKIARAFKQCQLGPAQKKGGK